MKKQHRQAELHESAHFRYGLRSNPCKKLARVWREVAMRKHNYGRMNADRKLTDEQRREKTTENKKIQEERKGLIGPIFKCAPKSHI